MSESNELNLIYIILQIVGIITFFICCLTCLYYRGINEKKYMTKKCILKTSHHV